MYSAKVQDHNYLHTQCRLFSLPTPALSETRSSRKMHVPYHLAIYVITSACGANLFLWLKAKIRYLPHHSDKTELAMLKSEIIKHCFHLSFFLHVSSCAGKIIDNIKNAALLPFLRVYPV